MASHELESINAVGSIASEMRGGGPGVQPDALSLDSLVGPALQATQTTNALGGMGKQVLEYGVSNPFLNGEISLHAPPQGGMIADAARESAALVGGVGTTEGQFADPRMNSLIDTMKEMYLESAKTMLAWNIVHQVSKDTKIMLQSQ